MLSTLYGIQRKKDKVKSKCSKIGDLGEEFLGLRYTIFATFLSIIFSKYSSLQNGTEMILQHDSAVCVALALAFCDVLVVGSGQAWEAWAKEERCGHS